MAVNEDVKYPLAVVILSLSVFFIDIKVFLVIGSFIVASMSYLSYLNFKKLSQRIEWKWSIALVGLIAILFFVLSALNELNITYSMPLSIYLIFIGAFFAIRTFLIFLHNRCYQNNILGTHSNHDKVYDDKDIVTNYLYDKDMTNRRDKFKEEFYNIKDVEFLIKNIIKEEITNNADNNITNTIEILNNKLDGFFEEIKSIVNQNVNDSEIIMNKMTEKIKVEIGEILKTNGVSEQEVNKFKDEIRQALEEYEEKLIQQNDKLSKSTEISKEEMSKLREEIRRASEGYEKLKQQNEELLKSNEVSEQEINKLKEEIRWASEGYEKLKQQSEEVLKSRGANEQDINELKGEINRISEGYEKLKQQNEELLKSNEISEQKLNEIAKRMEKKNQKRSDEIQDEFRRLYPNIHFNDEKIFKQLSEFPNDRLIALKDQLQYLQCDPSKVNFKAKIQGVPVREIQFYDDGRMYITMEGNTVTVWRIGDKSLQKKDIEWLKKNVKKC